MHNSLEFPLLKNTFTFMLMPFVNDIVSQTSHYWSSMTEKTNIVLRIVWLTV